MIFEKLSSDNYADFLSLYEMAFPITERRPYSDVAAFDQFLNSNNSKFNVIVAKEDNCFLGFITYWSFDSYIYIEHFAVSPELRGRNIGSMFLKHLMTTVSDKVLLEVELPETNDAKRRIGFYQRLGFDAHPDIDYIQPSYTGGLSDLHLMFMTHGSVDLTDWKEAIKPLLHDVYKYYDKY